jgi:hypothetical protein
MKSIRFYRLNEAYGEFSNFSPHPFELNGRTWPTAEHYFQAQKFSGTEHEEAVRLAKSPMVAARMGRSRERPRFYRPGRSPGSTVFREWSPERASPFTSAALSGLMNHEVRFPGLRPGLSNYAPLGLRNAGGDVGNDKANGCSRTQGCSSLPVPFPCESFRLSLQEFTEAVRSLLNQSIPPIEEFVICLLLEFEIAELARHLTGVEYVPNIEGRKE